MKQMIHAEGHIKDINETDTNWTLYFCGKTPMGNLAQFEKEFYGGLYVGDITLKTRDI